MKAAAFSYHCATSVQDALAALDNPNTRLLAGGQSLLPLLNQRAINAEALVDVSSLPELHDITSSNDRIRLGAGMTAAAIEDGGVSGSVGQMLAEVAAGIGYRAIRNRGTIGGGVAFADPAGDWPVTLTALAASVTVAVGGELRNISIENLYTKPFATSLDHNALITDVSIPALSKDAKWSYYKFSPTIGETTKAIAVAIVDPASDFLSLAVGAADAMPVRLDELEKRISAQDMEVLYSMKREDYFAAIAGLGIANSDYKLQCLSVALMRAVQKLA